MVVKELNRRQALSERQGLANACPALGSANFSLSNISHRPNMAALNLVTLLLHNVGSKKIMFGRCSCLHR
jgi:hypothetical protein